MDDIDINEYYKQDHHREFFVAAKQIIYSNECNEKGLIGFIESYKEIRTREFTEERSFHKLTHGLRNEILKDVDEWNMFLVRLCIGLEMALKGLFLHNNYNIFKFRNNKCPPLMTKEKFLNLKDYRPESVPLWYLGRNLARISEELGEYSSMIEYFRELRNKYVHFAYKEDEYSNPELITNFHLLHEFMTNFILPLLEEST